MGKRGGRPPKSRITKEGKYLCKFCNRRFVNPQTLANHIRVAHTGPYISPIDGKERPNLLAWAYHLADSKIDFSKLKYIDGQKPNPEVATPQPPPQRSNPQSQEVAKMAEMKPEDPAEEPQKPTTHASNSQNKEGAEMAEMKPEDIKRIVFDTLKEIKRAEKEEATQEQVLQSVKTLSDTVGKLVGGLENLKGLSEERISQICNGVESCQVALKEMQEKLSSIEAPKKEDNEKPPEGPKPEEALEKPSLSLIYHTTPEEFFTCEQCGPRFREFVKEHPDLAGLKDEDALKKIIDILNDSGFIVSKKEEGKEHGESNEGNAARGSFF